MPLADSLMPAGHELSAPLREAVAAAEALFDDARRVVANRVTVTVVVSVASPVTLRSIDGASPGNAAVRVATAVT